MKLIVKQNYTYLLLLMIISSQFLAIVDATSTKNKKNSRSSTSKKAKKFRKHGQVCYHSVPHWEEKHGNYPCAKGLICRPPAKSKAAKGKPVPHKCFKDNKKNRVAGNIHFASKKDRMNGENYLFSISYRSPRVIGREEEEGDIAQLGEDCAKATPDYKARKCVAGTTCRVKDDQLKLSGVTSYCLADNKAKEGEECSRPIKDYKKKECEDGLDCRPSEQDLASGISGVSSKCSKPLTPVKEGEVCRGLRTYRPCQAGLVCKNAPKPKDDGTKKIMLIESQTCQRDNSGKPVVGQPANENEVCAAQSGPSRSCAAGLVCRMKEQTGPIYISSQPMYCQKPKQLASENEACSSSIQGSVSKTCKAGLECRTKDSNYGMTGVSAYCLKPRKPVGEGEECWGGMSNVRPKD